MAIDGFKVTTPSDVMLELINYRNNYHEKGVYLGHEVIDEYYSMQLGNCTDWTGFPMSGKTQVLMELLMNTSLYHGWKHLIYFPDVGNNVEIIADLIHKKTSKSFDPTKQNKITDREIEESLHWVTKHFLVLTKTNVKAKMTPFQFWDFAVELKQKEGLHTASIDSWKDMSHPYNEYGGYATYLEVVLPYRNHIAEENNLHLHTIIHPKLTDKEGGKRAIPTPYDLKGGSEWFNSGKCMVTVHRNDTLDNIAEIHFNKIKPRSVGKVGKAELRFDKNTLTYYSDGEVVNGNMVKIYASNKGKENIKEVELPTFKNNFKPNTEFNDLPF